MKVKVESLLLLGKYWMIKSSVNVCYGHLISNALSDLQSEHSRKPIPSQSRRHCLTGIQSDGVTIPAGQADAWEIPPLRSG